MEVVLVASLPGSGEGAVSPAVTRVEEGLNCLAEDLSRHGQTELSEAAPPELVEVEHRFLERVAWGDAAENGPTPPVVDEGVSSGSAGAERM